MSRTQSTLGSAQNYGPKVVNEGLPNTVETYGVEKQYEVYFDYADVTAGLPTVNAATDAAAVGIPNGALVTRAYLNVTTAFASTASTTLQLGFQTETGGTVDADGLDSIAVTLLTDESWHVLDGADIGVATTVDTQVSIDDAVGTFSAGEARLVIFYIQRTTSGY